MNAGEARNAAQHWINAEAAPVPGFHGAFLHGSIVGLPPDTELPPTSDVDIIAVFDTPEPAVRSGKFLYQNCLLEVTPLPAVLFATPEAVLENYPLAGSLRAPGILADPTGHLQSLHEGVAREFAKRFWVERRATNAFEKVRNMVRSLKEDAPLHDQTNTWLFGAAITTHVLLVAGLQNPTVRRRYATVRDLLTRYGKPEVQETLLELLGVAHWTREQVEYHLDAMTDAFDAAKTLRRSPYRFASDLSDVARPISVDGSRDLIAQGYHREAVFWIAATFARCQWVFHYDAPESVREPHERRFHELLTDLGTDSFAERQARCERIEAYLPALWETAQFVLDTNHEIEDDATA
jgi:hypothetical protein